MDSKKRQPLGIELAKRGLITETDINRALEYQKDHPERKLGDILYILNICDPQKLIDAIADILDEKPMLLKETDIKINVNEVMAADVAKSNKVIPFDINGNKIKVCFADSADQKELENIRLLMLNKGYVMDRYITFETIIDKLLDTLEGSATDVINTNSDITALVDSIIKTGMEKRASDIHIEPMERSVRVRYRIDGILVTQVTIEKEKQAQIIGRLKAISNMHQERQDSQDGRIIMYPDYNIRVSSQKNVYGEKFVLRLLKKNSKVKGIFDLGFPRNEKLVNHAFNKKNSITVIAAPTGEGKTTTLYSIIDYLNKPEINIITIEDPVEIRIPGLSQVEVDAKSTFSDALRTVLRQDPDIVLVGEIRDLETAEIAMQAGQTGHYVLSTIHTIDAVEVITRLRKLGISNYDIASTLATAVSQRLVRKICPYCAIKRDFTEREKRIIAAVGKKYGVQFDMEGKTTYTAVGCPKCNNSGYYDRIAMFEILIIEDEIKELIMDDASSITIRRAAMRKTYKPLLVDGIKKILEGYTTLEEVNNKLVFF